MVDTRKEYRSISGIYTITNKNNGKTYIGSSIDIGNRWGEHLCTLRKNTHCNGHLQRSWNKHGEDAFEFKVIKLTQDLLDAEIYFVDQIKPAYNIRHVERHLLSEETKQKLRKPRCVNKEAAKASGKSRQKIIVYKGVEVTYKELAVLIGWSVSHTKKLVQQKKIKEVDYGRY